MMAHHDPESTHDGIGRRILLLVTALMLVAGAATGQISDRFQNLQVLPKDIAKSRLVEVMKSFCSALDVRCVHCHVGAEGAQLSEIDFVSDDNHHKQVTRVMMRMVDEINKTYLPKTGEDASELLQVQCVTCHRGQSKPRTLEGVLAAAVEESGTEAALARYRELRERYYGSATFDFSAGTLNRLAGQLSGAGKATAAIAFLKLNAELYPKEMTTFFFLGELYAKGGDKAMAIQSFEKALELDPRNRFVQRKLDELKGN